MLSTETPNTNSTNLERTFAIIKSDDNTVNQWIENQGFKIIESKLTCLEHDKWISFKSNEVYVFILEKTNAVKEWKAIIDSNESSFISKENAYGSPSIEKAEEDICLVFNSQVSSEVKRVKDEISEETLLAVDSETKLNPKIESAEKEKTIEYDNSESRSEESNKVKEDSISLPSDAEQLHEKGKPITETSAAEKVVAEEAQKEKVGDKKLSIEDTQMKESCVEEMIREEVSVEELSKEETFKEETLDSNASNEKTAEKEIPKGEVKEESSTNPASPEQTDTEKASIKQISENKTNDKKIHEQNVYEENVHNENELVTSVHISKEEPIKEDDSLVTVINTAEQQDQPKTESDSTVKQGKTRSNEFLNNAVKPSLSRLRQPALRRGNSLIHSEKELTRTGATKVSTGTTRIARLNVSPNADTNKKPAKKTIPKNIPRVAILSKKDIKTDPKGEQVKPKKKKMSPDFISRLTAPTVASKSKKTAGEPSPRPARTTLPRKQQVDTSKMKKKAKESVNKKTIDSAAGLATAIPGPSGGLAENNNYTEIKTI